MKKITLLFLLLGQLIFSQNKEIKLKTLYVSDSQNLILFFENPIVQGITGHSNYKFAFDVNEQNNYGVIRGRKGSESSLHIITSVGNVYAFKLQYKEKISVFSKFIKTSDAVGNTNESTTVESIKKDTVTIIPKENVIEYKSKQEGKNTEEVSEFNSPEKDESDFLYNQDREEFYRKFCSNLSSKSSYLKRFYVENQKVVIYLDEINYNRNELYFKLRVVNNSGIDFTSNFIKFTKVARKESKRASSQSLEIPFIYTYNNFTTIPANSENTAIYVFKKFGINDDKVINVELNEKKGERNLNLPINSKYINHAL